MLLAIAALATNAVAGINELRITEVNPATGRVEVTHAATNSFTTASSLPFCHLFNYSTVIPSGTVFGPGEAKVFTIGGLNSSASDLWLYRDGNFASPGSIITGLKFGSSASLGRTSVAVAAGIWPSTSAFVPLPDADQSLQPISIEATRTTSWFSGVPNFGSFNPAQVNITSISRSASSFVLEFSSPLPLTSHRLERRPSLAPSVPWIESTPTVTNVTPGIFQIQIPQSTNDNEFFRIKSVL